MDDQRMQAYVGLIKQILSCASGEELAVLQRHADLVDAGLITVMLQTADTLEQGKPGAVLLRQLAQQDALLLRQLAQQLAAALETANVGTGEATIESEQFLRAVLQLVADSEGDAQQVYPALAQHQNKLNESLLQVLPGVATQLLAAADNPEQRLFVAVLLALFGSRITHFPLGQRWLNIELGIAAYQQALMVMTQSAVPAVWSTNMYNLGLAYSKRLRGDRAKNIEQAIECYQQALSVITQSAMPVEWADAMNNLANAYSKRLRGDRAENIEQAIECYQQVLSVATQSAMPVDWSQTMMNLATACKNRIRGDRAENIEQAIECYQQALSVRTQSDMPVEWAETMMNLANAYLQRIRSDRAENIEQAIKCYQQALSVRTQSDMPVEWALTMMNLANAYLQHIRGDRAENIEQAIEYYQQALSVRTQSDMPVEWAETMVNLANAYSERLRGDRAENIEQAIECCQQVLNVMTQSAMPLQWASTINNLAVAYSDRIRGDRAKNIEQAIEYYQQALNVFRPDLLPKECRRTAQSLANLLVDEQRWVEAVQPYNLAMQAAEVLYQSSLFRSSQEAELAETKYLYHRAAYVLERTGNLEAAVVTLERGRARGLSETLQRDQSDLEQLKQLAPELYSQYQQAVDQLRHLEAEERVISATAESPPDQATLRQRASQIRDQLQSAIQSIRQLPGYADFIAQPDFADLVAAVKPGIGLVYLVPTPEGSLALALHYDSTHIKSSSPSIEAIWLDSLTIIRLQELLIGLPQEGGSLGGWFGAYINRQSNPTTWFNTINRITGELWNDGIGTLVQALRPLSLHQVVLIPTGYLSFLPLHAAWTTDDTSTTKRRYAIDLIPFTYAPNAQSFRAAQSIVDRTPVNSLLAIDQPSHRGASPLPNSTREVETATANFLQHQIFRHHQATTNAILSALPQHTVLHFSCHGYASVSDPLNSGLALAGDDLLTLRELLNLKLSGVRLAILSACETGIPGIELPDEVVSLPTGLLQAGVAGVVASLWSVSDFSTMLLLNHFYYLWRQEELEPAAALRSAQQWVRDTTNSEKATYFKNALTEQPSVNTPGSTVDYLYKQMLLSRPNQRDFSHPFHWAAFSYVGA